MAANPPTFLGLIPDGPAGIRETLKQMRQCVLRGKSDPQMHLIANRLVSHCAPKDFICEVAAIFDFVQKEIRYSLDPNEIELLRDPRQVIEQGTGDCDDKCIVLACLLELKGHAATLRALGFERSAWGMPIEEYSHVVVLTNPGADGEWVALDATEPNAPGWYPPGVTCTMDMPI